MDKEKALEVARKEQEKRLSVVPKPVWSRSGSIITDQKLMKALWPSREGKFQEKKSTKNEVFAKISYDTTADMCGIAFNFEDEKVVKTEVRGKGTLLQLNRSSEVVEIVLTKFSKRFGSGNKTRFAIEKDKKARISIEYDTKQDVLELRFSSRAATDFENDPEYYGVVRQYAGKELVGYTMAEFSKTFNASFTIPLLGVPR